MQTQARILAFKDLANLVAEVAPAKFENEWLRVGAALCWAGGCTCGEATRFEEEMLKFAAELSTVKGMQIRDIHGEPFDLARILAIGVSDEAIKIAEGRADEASRNDAGSQ